MYIPDNITETAKPEGVSFCHPLLTHAGWTVWEAPDYLADHHKSWFAVHIDTGETRTFDLSGWTLRGPDPQDFRDYIDLEFPDRSDAGTPGPISRADLDRLQAKSVAAE